MCGRFSFTPTAKIIEDRFNITIEEAFYKPRYNCAPSQSLAVISNVEAANLSYYRWGLIPFWAKDKAIGNKMINAKAETITEKPSFKNPFKSKRCLVLSDGFYEWKKGIVKVPYRITLLDKSLFAMAGLWDTWKAPEGELIHSFTIITTKANEIMEPIHNRMPVILKREDEQKWLHQEKPEELLPLLNPYPADEMFVYPISNLVNSPRNDTAEILTARNPV
ncbi:SOS response-associated peptidase [Bacteroidota bacterium]